VTRRRISPWLAGVAAALAATVIAGAAEPTDPSFQMTVSKRRVTLPGTTVLEYRLRMTTGSEPERFTVDVVPPLFQARAGTSTNVRSEGATITPAGPASLDGPGRLTPIGEGVALNGCTPSAGLRAHGYEPSFAGFYVELPPRSVATLVRRYRTGGVPLWPRSDLRLTADVNRSTGGHGAPTLQRDVVVRSPQVAIAGRTAPRLELWTTPPSSSGVYAELRPVAPAARLAIGGRATPARAGRRVSLWLLREGRGAQPRRLAVVSTDAVGRFVLRTLAPARAGSYELWSRTASTRYARPEHSCPIAFRVP
jgi:hypothetical protein